MMQYYLCDYCRCHLERPFYELISILLTDAGREVRHFHKHCLSSWLEENN